VKRAKVLRIAALPGEAPYFNKDIASGAWSGMCIERAKDFAQVFEAQVEYIESTYGNSVLDLQANKIDLAFSLDPTPKRALVIDFPRPFCLHGFGMVGKKGFHASSWSDPNKPEVKVAPAWACGWNRTSAGANFSTPGSITIAASSGSANGFTPGWR
jgi:polar amino acid transport system substrate-binding protein